MKWIVAIMMTSFTALLNLSVADTKDEAAALARQGQAGIEMLSRTAPDADKVPGFVGTSVPEAGYDPATLAAPEVVVKTQAVGAAEASMLALPTPVVLDADKFTTAIETQTNPGHVFDLGSYLSGQYGDCTPIVTPARASHDQRCDTWRQTDREKCYLNRQVEVEANVTYRCDKDSTRIHKTCERTLHKTCNSEGLCPQGGITKFESSGRYGFTLNDTGQINLKSGHSLGHYCSQRDSVFTFNIKNKDKVKTFRLTKGVYDDWMSITLNQKVVYVSKAAGSPDDGELYVDTEHYTDRRCSRDDGCEDVRRSIKAVFQDGKKVGSCERIRYWRVHDLDLKRYLVEGDNVLKIRVIISGGGSVDASLQSETICCETYRERWSETCE